MAKQHQYRNPTRRVIVGSVCGACLMDFGSRLRLLQHAQYSSAACGHTVRTWRIPLDDEELREADALDKEEAKRLRSLGRGKRLAEVPAYRRSGPLPRRVTAPLAVVTDPYLSSNQ